jgi:hypothetical protein
MALAGVTAILALFLVGNSPAAAEQRHMEDALSALKKAKSELEQASHDKGGHRENAIQRINEAISEVQQGIRYDDTHDDDRKHDRHHGRKVNLDDLEGMKARELDSTMSSRGFTQKGGYKQHHTSFTTWWNASTNQCVSVATQEGRVDKVESISEGNCN